MKEALSVTLQTIERRARLYKRTVVATSLILVATFMLVILSRSFFPLLAAIMVAPVTGLFFVLDNQHLHRWQILILRLTTEKRLDIPLLQKSAAEHPMIPQQTLRAMFLSLKSVGGQFFEKDLTLETQAALMENLRAAARKQQTGTILGVVGLSGILASLASFHFFQYKYPLVILLLSIFVWGFAIKRRG